MPEMWDLYNENREPIGETHERGKPIDKDKFHIVVDILSVNAEGKILITRRSPEKTFGGMWEITGGSAVSGETPRIAAARELFEETGLSADPSELEYRGEIVRRGSHGGNAIHVFFLHKGDFSEKDIRLQQGETTDFKILTPAEIKAMTDRGEFLDFSYDRMRAMFPKETE